MGMHLLLTNWRVTSSEAIIALSIIRCSKSAKKSDVQVCQVATVPKIIIKYCELAKSYHINRSETQRSFLGHLFFYISTGITLLYTIKIVNILKQ